MQKHVNYKTFEYYQNLLVSMSIKFSDVKRCPAKRHRPGQILSVSEEEIRTVIGVAPTKKPTRAIKTERDDKHPLVLVSVKRNKVGASRRSRHLNRERLKALI